MSHYPSLFISCEDWHNNACLNFQSDMSYGYIEGYIRAGDILADYIAEHARDQDALIYPILFCYRHHLELRMKEIIKQGRILLNEGVDYEDGHKLGNLWPLCREIIAKVWDSDAYKEEIKLIDHFVSEMETVDRQSDAFRYWETSKKSGRKPHLEGIKHVNIRHYRECIKSMTDFLDGVAMGIDVHLSHMQDSYLD